MTIKLGEMVKDTLTGLEGMATSKIEYLYGCVRVGVEPKELKDDGTTVDVIFFDEQRLEPTERKKTKSKAKTGGPGPVPPSRDPK